jgi:magnesium chelatase accessory protein
MSDRPIWSRDGRDWPNREFSRFVDAAGFRWHVQVMGQGPALLLLHGTGAATHSWRDLAPILARDFTVIAPDMPGHGFTEMPPGDRLSLPGMARDIGALLTELKVEPVLAAGHSAGAAILVRMALDGHIEPRHLVSLNGALLPLFGVPTQLFRPVAKMVAAMPLMPELFAWRASDPAAIARLLKNTGSTIDRAGADFYARLAAKPGHVAGALGMMSNWDLKPIQRELPMLKTPLTLAVGSNDGTISPSDAYRVRTLLPSAQIVSFAGLGHLAHEEKPTAFAELITRIARSANVLH